jgi:PAS domain S-box-containing protein
MSEATARILVVDDRAENLVAMKAVLEPLGHDVVCVDSGVAALREILADDFACILLDVQMPELDGFELARLIKSRERSQNIPIVFVTALSKDDRHVFRGYSEGAVDYIFKPVDPDVLRSKVSVFIDLWQKTQQLHAQSEQLLEQELLALEQASEQRYRQLADAMPQIVWTADHTGETTYLNRQWFASTGMTAPPSGVATWTAAIHPDDMAAIVARREETLRTGETFEADFRFRSAAGGFRWHLARALPVRDENGAIDYWIGTATDIHDRRVIEDQRAFIIAAGDALSSSLDYRSTLAHVAELAVPDIADSCAVHVVEPGVGIAEIALAHADPAKLALARELQERGTPDAATVIGTGEAQLATEITDEMLEQLATDELHLDLLRNLDLQSYMCVPLTARGRVLGAITLIASDSGRRYGAEDLLLAEELARRAATAIENSRLFREAEERGRAARVLATIGDGVFLLDADGLIRLWNPAAERITGFAAADVTGRPVASAIPGWEALASRIPVAHPGEAVRAESVPLDLEGRELWLSVSAVGFEDGTVFAFRDLTEERSLENLRQDLVATVSHELRTPLAAIYGAALTLRRDDIELEQELSDKLLEVIAEEAERLAEIVNDLLMTSQLDSGKLHVKIESCDPLEIVRVEVDAAQARLPDNVDLAVAASGSLPAVAADPGQLRQVLANLIDNAIKYSPDGGAVTVALEPEERYVRFAVRDTGLGIPPGEQARVFEKFYRVDPHMSRGIGGTGLGLYICRELVRRVDGRIWVESDGASGSTFVVEIPRERGARAAGNGDGAGRRTPARTR